MWVSVPVAFLAGSIGPGEVVFLFLIILLFFGPRRLPDLARQIGKAVSELRRASQNFRDQVMQMDKEPPASKPVRPAESTATESASPKTSIPQDGTSPASKEKKDHDLAG
jgi:sec-independent protein translocase protein TatB